MIDNKPKPHIHHKIMAEYAQVASITDEPWLYFEYNDKYDNKWVDLMRNPLWCESFLYRRKEQ